MSDPPDLATSDPGPGPDEHDADLFDDDGGEDLIGCPACGAEIYAGAERCPRCGHWLSRAERAGGDDARQRLWKWLAILLAVLLVLWLVL